MPVIFKCTVMLPVGEVFSLYVRTLFNSLFLDALFSKKRLPFRGRLHMLLMEVFDQLGTEPMPGQIR